MRLAGFVLAIAILSACHTSADPVPIITLPVSTETPFPTIPPIRPTNTPPPPTPIIAEPPAVILPGGEGYSVVCEANALRLPLEIDGAPVGVISRVETLGDHLYLIADGGLYQLPRLNADAAAPALEPVLMRGESIAGRVVQELADLAVGGGQLYALDKAGHVYALDPLTGRTRLAYRAQYEETLELGPQLVAMAVDEDGRPVMMDTALGALWTPGRLQALEAVGETLAVTSGVDLTYAGDEYYVLLRNGAVNTVSEPVGSYGWQGPGGRDLALSVFTSDHLGPEMVYVVDALAREISGYQRDGSPVTRLVFTFPGIGLLRDGVFSGGRLYAVADGDLIVYPGPASQSDGDGCSLPALRLAQPTLYGVDVVDVLGRYQNPLTGATLPPWPRVYPGASRIYRMGVHRGLDIYHWNAGDEFGIGTPVYAMSGGVVRVANVGYPPMEIEEFERLVAESERAGATPAEHLERFAGRQVMIDHGDGVRTAYLHLDEIADGVRVGRVIDAGQMIGTVGVTGTQGEAQPGAAGAHLHYEIWIGERYLGEGLTLPETMWWYEQILGE